MLVHFYIKHSHTTQCWYTCISTVTPQCAGTPAYQQSHHSVLVHLRVNSHTTFCCYTWSTSSTTLCWYTCTSTVTSVHIVLVHMYINSHICTLCWYTCTSTVTSVHIVLVHMYINSYIWSVHAVLAGLTFDHLDSQTHDFSSVSRIKAAVQTIYFAHFQLSTVGTATTGVRGSSTKAAVQAMYVASF